MAEPVAPLSLVVLISGSGRNLKAILQAIADGKLAATVAAVISNKHDAAGLQYAQAAGVPVVVIDHRAYSTREAFDAALIAAIDPYQPGAVVLAGFMRILTPGFVRHYLGRCLNIHPSLLPRHKGLHTHQAAIDAGDAEHGATVHFVTPELDGGPLVLQGALKRRAEDTAHSLAERVMHEIELRIYPQTLRWLAQGRLRWQQGQVWFDGKLLAQPLGLRHLDPEFAP